MPEKSFHEKPDGVENEIFVTEGGVVKREREGRDRNGLFMWEKGFGDGWMTKQSRVVRGG